MVDEEKRNYWKETRRHISLDYLKRYEVDIEAPDSDPFEEFIEIEEKAELHKAILLLSPKQQSLINRFIFEGMTTRQISEIEGVDRTAISHRLATIYKRLRKLL